MSLLFIHPWVSHPIFLLVDKSEKMLSLPTGGGFFIKGTATSAATALSPR